MRFSQFRYAVCLVWLSLSVIRSVVAAAELDLSKLIGSTAVSSPTSIESPLNDYATLENEHTNSPSTPALVPLSSGWVNLEQFPSDTLADSGLGVFDKLGSWLPVTDQQTETLFKPVESVTVGTIQIPWGSQIDEEANFPTGYRQSDTKQTRAVNRELQQVSINVSTSTSPTVTRRSSTAHLFTLSAPVLAIIVAVGMMALIVRKH